MATLTLDEFLTKARPLNPDYTDNELIQAYQDRYTTPPTQTVSAAPLMTLDEFLPKARKLNPDYSDEELTSAWQEKYGDRGAREKDQGDTVRGFKESFQQVPQMAAGLAAGAGAVGEKIFGEGGLSTALKNTGIKNYREVEQDIARDSKPSDSLSEAYNMARAGNSGALVDWLQHGLGYVGGQGLQALATAGIGYAGGKLLLKPAAETLAQKLIAKESARIAGTEAGARLTAQELTKQATSNVAGKIGQVAALGSVATGMEGGEIHGDLVSQAEQEGRSLTGWELAKAFAASLGAGALEFVGDKIGVDLLLGKSIANRLAKTRLGNVAAGAAVGAVAESGTEALQTPIEQLGKGQDPTSPESVRETIDSAALGALGGTAMGATGGAFTRPQGAPAPTVTERTPDEMGLGQHASAEQSPAPTSPFQIEGFPQAGEVRKGRVYGGGPVLDVSPLPDVSPILKAGSLDDAIAGAVGVVQGATETAKSRASEFARMTAKAKNETDALLANAPEKRPAFDVPTLPKPEAQPATLFNQPSLIVPGQAFTPRPEPIDDPRDRLAEERARMVAQREQQRMQQQANPVSETVAPAPAVQQTDTPLPSQIDLAYPSSKKVRDLIHEKGLHLDTPVFREILKQTVKKEQFADLTPQELQTLAEAVQKINAPQQPTPLQEAPPQVPLTPAKEKPYAPVTTIPEAQVPRSELTPEKNTEMLLRAEKAKADLEIAGTERGGRFQLEQTGTGSTNEVRGLKSATADWYKDLTSGPSPAIRGDRKQSAREKIEVAIQKIIKDQGADRGRAVEQVKAALLQDTEFHKTEWGRDLSSILQGEWPEWIEKPQGVTQATENAQPLQNVPKRTTKENGEVYENMPNLREKSGRNAGAPNGFILSPMQGNENEEVQGNPSVDQGTAGQDERQELRSRLQGQGEDTQKAVPEMRLGEGGNASRGLQQADAGGMAVQALSSGTSQPNKVAKVPLSRTERLAQQKQKMEAKKPELLPSETPGMEPQLATASPEPSTQKAAPKTEEPFTLTGPDVSNPKVKESGPEQLSIDVPPPTVGERPIIGREATIEEAPLFSKAAQEKDPEQISLDRATIPAMATERGPGSSGTAQQPPEPGRVVKDPYGEIQLNPKTGMFYAYRGAAEFGTELNNGQYFTADLALAQKYAEQARPYGDVQRVVVDFNRLFDSRSLPVDAATKDFEQFYRNYGVDESYEFDIGKTHRVTYAENDEGLSAFAHKHGFDGYIGYEAGKPNVLLTPQAYKRLFTSGDVEGRDAVEAGVWDGEEVPPLPNSSSPQQGGPFVTPAKTAPSEPVENTDDTPIIPKQDSGTSQQSPTEILAAALRTVADQIQGKPAESQDTLNTVEAYERFRGRLRDGEITLDEYKQAFKQLNDNKEVIVGGLKKLTKDQLIKQSNSWRSRKGDSKDELIRQVYDGMLGTFALGRGVSYVLSGKGGYEQALAKMVAETTEADLTKYAEDIAKSRAEYKQKLEGFANPQTLEDFDTRVRIKGEDSLTPEQLARYDELLSHAGREKRKQAQEQKSTEKLPEGTFNDASLMATTGVNARMVVVEKPESVTVQELSAKYGLTDHGGRGDNQPYVLREGESKERSFELAKDAINSLNEDGGIYQSRGDLSGDRVPSRTVALGISPQFIEQGTIDLTGQVVSSAEDLAKLAQVYRNPLFETLRIFYVKGGKILGHEGITSRLPGLVKVGITKEEVMQRVGDWDRRKQALGATSYYLLHNHPSGNSAPSQADFALTGRIASLLPGFKGHVVIDSNEFTNIATDAQGNLYPSTRKMDFGKDRLLTPSMPHPLLNATVLNHTDMARVGKSMQAPKGFATILYRSGGKAGKTRAIQEVSAEFLTNPGQAKQYIQQQADAFGAVDALVHYSVQNNDQLADRLARSMDALIEQGIVVDYVTSGEMGRSMSRRELGVEPKTRSTSMGRAIEDIPTETTEEERAPYETGTINPTEARDRLVAVKTSMRPYLLGALGLEQLSQVYGKDHAEVHQYNKATQAMEADFTEMSRESDKVARAWTDLNIPVADKMAQAMEDARFLNFDPDPRKKQEADSQKKKELRTRFDQLPEEAKTVYRMARDFYTNMAEQRFQALKERIERAGGTPENTRKFVDRLQIAYEQVRSKVYFPFTRFGENIVVAKKMENGVEKDREVHAFESVAESQKFATMMKLKGWQVKQTVAREYSVDKEGPASKIVRQMHDIIKELGEGQQGLPGVLNLEDQLLDSLNQSFLQALPDMSYAKHFIHAKDVKGASRDALRSFAHSALHGAHHISRIRHADTVTNALIKLDDKINGTTEGDTTEARQVYNELVKRHNDIMNPNTHPVSAWLGQLGFTMSLGGVVATGITNATQVPLVTYPWLGARYGFGKASAALARAYKDFLDPRTLNKDSLFDATKSKLISESERKMLLELARRGHIDLTQTMDLAGLSSRDNLSRKARTLGTVGEKVSRMLGFTFHVPEVMNRQVTALATFRLEKAKDGATFETALEKAQQAIQDTHFIYQAHNRPRYMSGNFLRVLTMFKQYSQNIAYTYGRAASIWLDKNHATKEERRVAKRQLASMLTLQFGAAGALGMPFFGTPVALIMHALGAMDDDDDQDWEVAFRQWLDGKATSLAEAFIDDKTKAREVGKEMAEVVSHGASRLTPWDMASRLGQNDLFFREPQREREGRSAVMDWMMALGGPVPSYGVNFLLGMGDVAKGMSELNAGFFMRGVEELTPAVLRHGVKSLRYTLEGVRTRDEYKQMDLNAAEKLGQIFGFTPARVAEMYESTTAVKNKEHRILNQQKALKDRFARAVDDQDDQAKQHILEDIRGFNERNPIFAITSNTLNRSIKTRRQHEAGMERGMYLPPRRRALLEEADFGDY